MNTLYDKTIIKKCYGYDIASKFIEWSAMETIIVNNVIPHLGIEAEYLEVVICKKANI